MQTSHTPPERTGATPLARCCLRVSCLRTASPFDCRTFQTGCRSNNRYDLIEAELRTRERELADTRAALEQSRNLLRAYEASQRPASAHRPTPRWARCVRAGEGHRDRPRHRRRGRGRRPRRRRPDGGDRAARRGRVRGESAGAGDGRRVGDHTRRAEEPDRLVEHSGRQDSARRGKAALFSTGYFVAVPWQTLPSTDRVRVAVRLITTDGRAVRGRPRRDRETAPSAARCREELPYPQPIGPSGRQPLLPEMPPPGVPSALPPGTEELPPPMRVERGARSSRR